MHIVLRFFVTSSTETRKAGEQHKAAPDRSELHHYRQLFQQIGQRLPKVSVVPLQGLDLVGLNADVGICTHRHWVEVVDAPPLEVH